MHFNFNDSGRNHDHKIFSNSAKEQGTKRIVDNMWKINYTSIIDSTC